MSAPTLAERLYALLPAIHRRRDAESGQALRALFAVAEEQLVALETDVGRLYESWFIETCPEWVVPYIGDLLATRGLNVQTPRTYSQRAYVANTISYRRRKGTAAMLEQLAQDLTGWPAHAVEYFQVLATTQYLAHLRLFNKRCEVRDASSMGRLGGPFDDVPRTAEVRRIDSGRGRFNLPNIGIHLYRLETAGVTRALALPAAEKPQDQGLFRFSPFGQDAPLWNRARDIADVSELADEASVPCALRRRALFDALADWRGAKAAAELPPRASELYFGAQPVVAVDGLTVDDIVICNLSTWRRPPDALPSGAPIKAAIDPQLGRLAFTASEAAKLQAPPRVSYFECYSGRLGGGAYERADVNATPAAELQASLAASDPDRFPADRPDSITPDATITGGGGALNAAIAAAGGAGIIAIDDFLDYQLGDLNVPDGKRLAIRAADRKRPVLRLGGPRVVTLGKGASLELDGVWLEGGGFWVEASTGGSVRLRHATMVPGFSLTPGDGAPVSPDAFSLACGATDFVLMIERSICGRVLVPSGRLFARDSIIDGAGGAQLAAYAAEASLLACTVFGNAAATVVNMVSDCIFTGALWVDRAQEGCVRYSYLPRSSVAPQQYRCQPALALKDVLNWYQQLAIATRVSPTFTSTRFGQPGYGQLTPGCAPEIRGGASDQGEMGALQFLQQTQRESNLRASLDEYLRFGLEAGLFFVT
jgi:hypothetical protein